LGLADLIDAALAMDLINQSTADQARLAKDFRNLIHPGRVLRKKETCEKGTAHGALAAAELVARDISRP
jgi:hypothetical protein